MSSKSSECNWEMYYGNENETNANLEGYGYGTSPFCATMGQPLIYYAEVPQLKRRPRSEKNDEEQDNRNCFTKAFHWYTQELVPRPRDKHHKKSDPKGFATWLDSKYEQFMQENQYDEFGFKIQHTSITEAYKFKNDPEESRRRRFRVKSPWRKKRKKEVGDVDSKNDRSFDYIMKPKEIVSRPASECFEITMEANRLDETPQDPQDATCRCSTIAKKHVTTQYDPSTSESPSQAEPMSTPCPICRSKITKSTNPIKPKITNPIKLQAKPSSFKQELVICKCPKEIIPKADAQSQSQIDIKTSGSVLKKIKQCPCEDPILQNDGVQIQTANSSIAKDSIQTHTENSTILEEDVQILTPNLTNNATNIDRSVQNANIKTNSNSVQTSDHSIQIEKDGAPFRPLFMKIVFADKLTMSK